MRWAMIEALEARALLSAFAPADGEERAEADVALSISVSPGGLIVSESNPTNVLFDSIRNQLIILEGSRIERFRADDWSRADLIFAGNQPNDGDISPDG